MFLLLAHTLILATAGIYVARRLCSHRIDQILAAAMIGWGNIVLTALALSVFRKLGDPVWFFRGSLAISLSLLALIHLVPSVPEKEAPPEPMRKSGKFLFMLLVASLGVLCLANVVVAVAYNPTNYDSLTYHLSRVMYYLGQGSLEHFPTMNIRQTYFPFNFNLLQLFCFVYGAPLQSVVFLNLLTWCGAILAVFRISRLVGASRLAALCATWLVATSTQVLAQATSTTHDLPTGFALLATVLFGMRWGSTGRRRSAILAGISLGLAAGTKMTVVFFAPVATLVLFIYLVKKFRKERARFVASIGIWVPALLVTAVIAAPYALFNRAATGTWMTSDFDFLLNRPFSPLCAYNVAKAYGFQFFFEPLQRFHFSWENTMELNDTAARTFFSNWDPRYAVSPFYLFPPDVNEDHVWFGFAGPFALACAFFCLLNGRLRRSPVAPFALVSLGWLLCFFSVYKWSLYTQRYFLPSVLLMAPCIAMVLQGTATYTKAWRRVVYAFTAAVAMTSLWFAADYLVHDSNRPLLPVIQGTLPPSVTPPLPGAMVARLEQHEDKIHIVSRGTNERIFLVMAGSPKSHFTSDVNETRSDAYNILSYWALSKDRVHFNIPQNECYVVLELPSKRTAGVEELGFIGPIGTERFNYVGLAKHPDLEKSKDTNSNILVQLNFGQTDPGRYKFVTTWVYGLNEADAIRVDVVAQSVDGTRKLRTTSLRSGSFTSWDDMEPERFIVELFRTSDGAKIGSRVIPFVALRSATEEPPAIEPQTLFRANPIVPAQRHAIEVDGLAEFEGPYDEYDLPIFRWAQKPTVKISLPSDPRLKRVRLDLELRLQVRDQATLEVVHNGVTLKTVNIQKKTDWVSARIEVPVTEGANVIELRDVPIEGEPPAPSSLYFMFRRINVTGFSEE